MILKNKYKVIGLMSGTSLDGLDMAYCVFSLQKSKWLFEIFFAETQPYSSEWKNRLQNASHISSGELKQLDLEYGQYMGRQVARFIQKHQLKPDLLASHGHTVFHKPEEGITLQIGNGHALRKAIDCPLVFDFRTQDVQFGGQGAPLVPIGDHLLFSDFDACVNIGGFANISAEIDGTIRAWDICPANIMMNPIAEKLGKPFDVNGNWAREGSLNESLLEELNNLNFYKEKAPKSLGKEWVDECINPIINRYVISEKDLLHTLVEHTSQQVAEDIKNIEGKVLFTGGGVFNSFLMEKIQSKTNSHIIIPDKINIEFKEALIFAFMGLLRFRNEANVYASVTGASEDHSSGKIIN